MRVSPTSGNPGTAVPCGWAAQVSRVRIAAAAPPAATTASSTSTAGRHPTAAATPAPSSVRGASARTIAARCAG